VEEPHALAEEGIPDDRRDELRACTSHPAGRVAPLGREITPAKQKIRTPYAGRIFELESFHILCRHPTPKRETHTSVAGRLHCRHVCENAARSCQKVVVVVVCPSRPCFLDECGADEKICPSTSWLRRVLPYAATSSTTPSCIAKKRKKIGVKTARARVATEGWRHSAQVLETPNRNKGEIRKAMLLKGTSPKLRNALSTSAQGSDRSDFRFTFVFMATYGTAPKIGSTDWKRGGEKPKQNEMPINQSI
jgi:hypothetical protein